MEDVKLFNDKKVNDIVEYLIGYFETKANDKIKEVRASDTFVNHMIDALNTKEANRITKKYSLESIDKIEKIIRDVYSIFPTINGRFSSIVRNIMESDDSIELPRYLIEQSIDCMDKEGLSLEMLISNLRQVIEDEKYKHLENVQINYANNKINLYSFATRYTLKEYLKAKLSTITITSLEEVKSIIENSINYDEFIYRNNYSDDCDCESKCSCY